MNRVNRKHAELHLGGPTFRWVHLCLNAVKCLPNIILRVEIPVLILQSEKEKIVDNKKLGELAALFPNARCETVQNAKHEILFERDEIRAKVMDKLRAFYCSC